MLVVRNEDVPGMIATVASALADAGVNIDDMDVGRSPQGEAALMVLATSSPVPACAPEGVRACAGARKKRGMPAKKRPKPDTEPAPNLGRDHANLTGRYAQRFSQFATVVMWRLCR
jgi:hypothetical protein